MIFGKLYSNCGNKGSDGPNLFAIFHFAQNVADLWSDLLFVIVLYVDDAVEDFVFLFCLAFVLVPYFISCCIGVYCITRWRLSLGSENKRLVTYLKSYDVFMYGLTAIAGFYASVNLCRSKLLYLDMFNLQLIDQEMLKLSNYRFVNVVLLENVPQFVIQVYYLINITSSTNGGSYEIVFVSMTFSVISIIAACLSQASRICNQCRKRSDKFGHQIYLTGNFIICSGTLQKSHAFAHKKIENCISHVLDTCNDAKQWAYRSDVDATINVYFIENQIKTLNQMQVRFRIKLSTMADYGPIAKAMTRNMNAMAKPGQANYIKFGKALRGELKLSQMPKISISDLNSVLHDGTAEGEVMIKVKCFIFILVIFNFVCTFFWIEFDVQSIHSIQIKIKQLNYRIKKHKKT